MYVFLRQPEDEIIEEYFSNPENIKHLVTFLNSIDALAYFAEVLHKYVNVDPNLKTAVYSSGGMREFYIREHTEKLKFMIDELVSTLEFGNLKSLARANYEAFLEAKREKPRMSMWKAFKELRDPEVKLTIGFLLLLMKKVGKVIEGEEDIR
ncbi:MAG: DUF1641 domain-containing protein [Aquifex sp.]|nr:MAG: DUF1641 domain-containing protein [Aquifex sp.]